MTFQACIGPGTMRVMHLRDAMNTQPMNGDLVLCGSTSVFHDFKGKLDASKLCKKCVAKFFDTPNNRGHIKTAMTAEEIGVQEIIPSSRSS